MTNEAVNATINNYVRDRISPKPSQRSYIKDKYDELQSFLVDQCFQSGSYARFTAVHPVKDLDVIWITINHDITDNPRIVLEKTARYLEEKYEGSSDKPSVTIQDHSITLVFEDDKNGFAIDVVPGIPQTKKNRDGDPIYCVPEIQKMSHHQRRAFTGTAAWILSDPKGYITAATKLEESTNGTFRKVAKFMKAWRQKHKEIHEDKFRLKSFHLELIVAAYLANNPRASVVEAIVGSMGMVAQSVQRPQYTDLANDQQFVDEYVGTLSSEERSLILKLQSEGYALVSQLETAASETELSQLLNALTQPKAATPQVTRPSVVTTTRQPWGY